MRFCLGCNRHVPVEEYSDGRCRECATRYQRDKSRRRRRTARERVRRQSAIKLHVTRHGWICPGHNREPHESHDLTADHVLPVARGGHEEGAIRVLCRSCNSTRGMDGGGHGPRRESTPGHPALAIRERIRPDNDFEPLVG
jgi:hypothetical protein